MKITRLSALLGVLAPLTVSPLVTVSARAQDRAEFQDVPRDHWAYGALQRLMTTGLLEGYPPAGEFRGNRLMTRYEFAVAIARQIDRFVVADGPYLDGLRLDELAKSPIPDINRAQLNDLLAALQREFRDELATLGSRVETLETHTAALENRVAPPPRFTLIPSISHRTGIANYIDNSRAGRTFLNPLLLRPNPFDLNALFAAGFIPDNFFVPGVGIIGPNLPAPAFEITPRRADNGEDQANKKFASTDFGLRLSNRVSNRLSLTAELRALGSNQEDPWAGDSQAHVYLREAFASADLGRVSPGIRDLSATLGRQRTIIGQGLLYDNQLSPTDQLRADFSIGPLKLSGFIGSTNNVTGLGQILLDPYVTQGAVFYLNTGFVANDRAVGFPGFGIGQIDRDLPPVPGNLDLDSDFSNGSFASQTGDDNESLIQLSANLFRIGGQPVRLSYARLFDGFRLQRAESLDLEIPILGLNIGIEAVRNLQTASGNAAPSRPDAFIATISLLKTRVLDLGVAYGRADDDFVYNVISSANPFARTYGEAIFDRPIALGSPLMSDLNGGAFLAAKRTFDVKGSLRLPFLRRAPLDFRYYTARSGANLSAAGPGIQNGGARVDLGRVYSLGTMLKLAPGLDLSVLGGIYDPKSNVSKVRYLRIGAGVGF